MKNKIKNIAMTMLICISAAVLLTGCIGTEVNKRVFVQLMGIEKNGGVYEVNLQFYSPQSSNGSPDISQSNSASVSGNGSTLYEAVANAELRSGKELFLGHTKLIIIGTGITEPSDELLPLLQNSISPICPVVYSREPASITDTFMSEGLFSADRLTKIMDSNVRSGNCIYTTFAQLTENTGTLNAAAAIPIIQAENESISFNGAAFAEKGGIQGHLASEDTLGLKLLLDDFKYNDKIPVTVSVGDAYAAVDIIGSDTKKYADISDGRLRVNTCIDLKINITENRYNLSEQQISQAVCKSIQDNCISAYSTSVWYSGCDVFGIYKLVRRDRPDFILTYNSDRTHYLKDSILNITVKAKQ